MRKLKLREGTNVAGLFGHHDRHVRLIEDELDVQVSARSDELANEGSPEAVRVVNTPPDITHLVLDPFPPQVDALVTAYPEVRDPDRDQLSFPYRWVP